MKRFKLDVKVLKREADVYSTLRKWQHILGLDDWNIDLNISLNPVACKGVGSDHRRNFMEVNTRWQYMRATIEVDRPQLEDMASDDPLDEHIVHELVHVLLAETTRTANDDDAMHEERVVTLLTKHIMELYARTEGTHDSTDSTTHAEDRDETE